MLKASKTVAKPMRFVFRRYRNLIGLAYFTFLRRSITSRQVVRIMPLDWM